MNKKTKGIVLAVSLLPAASLNYFAAIKTENENQADKDMGFQFVETIAYYVSNSTTSVISGAMRITLNIQEFDRTTPLPGEIIWGDQIQKLKF